MSALQPLYVYGSGGHAKVVAEAALAAGGFNVLGFLDDEPARVGATVRGLSVRGRGDLPSGAAVAMGIGSNAARSKVAARLRAEGVLLAIVVHPSAVVSAGSQLGDGSFVAPLALVHVDARLGRGCIVNSGAVVEHDSVLEDWVHVAPNAALGGEVRIGEGALIGLGACILPRQSVGAWTTVGAGAVVSRPLPAGVKAAGAPARALEEKG